MAVLVHGAQNAMTAARVNANQSTAAQGVNHPQVQVQVPSQGQSRVDTREVPEMTKGSVLNGVA